MTEFFEVWKYAKDAYGLSRIVYINLDEAYIRIYQDETVIVQVKGTPEELEDLYIAAALRLLQWMQMRGVKLHDNS